MRSVTVIAPAAIGLSTPVILDQHLTPQEVGMLIKISAGASLTTKVQWSLDDPNGTYTTSYNADAVWLDDKNLVNITSGNIAGVPINSFSVHQPVRAIRLNNTAWASGTATLVVVQCGGIS